MTLDPARNWCRVFLCAGRVWPTSFSVPERISPLIKRVSPALNLGNISKGVRVIANEAAYLAHLGGAVQSRQVVFTESGAAGVYTGSVDQPADTTLLDIVVDGIALWGAGTSATMIVGDADNDDGYYTAVNLKATDLLAGESISFALAGGKVGAYIANSQVSPRYTAAGRSITGVVTTVGTTATTGRTRMTAYFATPAGSNRADATYAAS